ncbi:hypothetical protein [Micromonospora sp. CPCC 206060]|uniref:hypothetical protein n=1 Tax=Micromonospora sp. CPCC 206060 TaxID=3122406 RepID=UPI003FA5CFEA
MKAHRTDGVSLFFGLLFLTLAVWWLLAQLLDLALPAIGWFLAGGLILVGLFGLLGALRSGRHAPGADRPVTAPPGPAGPTSGAPVPTGPTSAPPARETGAAGYDPVEPVTAPPAPGER